MRMMTRTALFYLLIILFGQTSAQITNAKITFERRTNLYKKYRNNNNLSRWVKEDDKIKTEVFELFITDTMSLFRPQESNLKEMNTWMTSKNTVYQYLAGRKTYSIKTMWGEELHLTDTLRHRKWKMTSGTRKIAGYECRKAYWQANDTIRVYAWFSHDLVTSTGPETFNGLPGTILGLAMEDGGVVYFARKVEPGAQPADVFVRPNRKKVYAVPELKARLTRQYGHEKWFAPMLFEQFEVW
jgi:GLPGLI family protein